MIEKLTTEQKKSNIKPLIIMLVITGLIFGGIFAWKIFTWHMMNRYFATMKAPPVAVSTTKAGYQEWQPQIKASASVRATKGVDVTTEIPGIVSVIRFTPGATVNANDLLLELNTDSDVAHLHSLQAAVDLAQTVAKRDKALFAAHAISKVTLDADAADLKSKLALADEQKALVNKKIIHAPFAGRLGVSAVNPGAYIKPGDKIVTLQSLDPIYVDFYIPQQEAPKIAVDQIVTISTDTYPGKTFTGKVTTVDPKVDIATRNIQVEATLENPSQALLPGMFASVKIESGVAQHYLTLPQTAISYNPYGEIIYIVKETGKDNKGKPVFTVTQNFVTVGETRGNQVAVLSGLKADDIVVTAGQLKLKNGTPVIINNSVLPSDDPKSSPTHDQ